MPPQLPCPLDVPGSVVRSDVDPPPVVDRPCAGSFDDRMPVGRILEVEFPAEQLDGPVDDAVGSRDRPLAHRIRDWQATRMGFDRQRTSPDVGTRRRKIRVCPPNRFDAS